MKTELKRVRDLPHRGPWTPPIAGQLPEDRTALAMWLQNDDPTITR